MTKTKLLMVALVVAGLPVQAVMSRPVDAPDSEVARLRLESCVFRIALRDLPTRKPAADVEQLASRVCHSQLEDVRATFAVSGVAEGRQRDLAGEFLSNILGEYRRSLAQLSTVDGAK